MIMDEIHIRKHIQWSEATGQRIGLVNNNNTDIDNNLATSALVFMVCGLNTHFRIPVAYYFLHSISAVELKDKLINIIDAIQKCGAKVTNVTSDGLITNIKALELLGGDFKTLKEKFEVNGEKIYLIQDPCHMIKLVRNALASYGTIYDQENRKIQWKYFVALEKLNNGSSFQFTNKMTKRHIQWTERIMHVGSAVQSLSNSTASSMQFAMDSGVANFEHASATVKFIRIFNDLFDICNTFRKQDSHANQYKSALNENNKEVVFHRLCEIKAYIMNLKMGKSKDNARIVSVLDSDRKAAFRGFLITIASIEGIYHDYVTEKQWMQFFPTFRISQDHLETFFSKIRSKLGQNDNPTCQQFSASYRKLLYQPNTSFPKLGNISLVDESDDEAYRLKNVSNILTVSSRQKKVPHGNEGLPSANDDLSLEDVEYLSHVGELLNGAGIAYVASKLEKILLGCGQIYCMQCKHILENNVKLDSRQCVGEFRPCEGTFRLCKQVAQALKIYSGTVSCRNKVLVSVLTNLNVSSLYIDDQPESHDRDHVDFIISYVIKGYIGIAQNRSAKNDTLNLQNKFLRQKSKTNIKYSGQ